MDIRIGGTAPIGPAGSKLPESPAPIEARVLAVRPPRQHAGGTPVQGKERRENPRQRDPRGGRVLVLMIPEERQLPRGLARGEFRVFLRFVRR